LGQPSLPSPTATLFTDGSAFQHPI